MNKIVKVQQELRQLKKEKAKMPHGVYVRLKAKLLAKVE